MGKPGSIFHLVLAEEWAQQDPLAIYTPQRFGDDGFIHCSYKSQLARTASQVFSGRTDLLVLEIDPSKLDAEVRVEAGGGESEDEFPHIYGPLNKSAIVRVVPHQS